jgi:hypothetical protein
VLFGMIYHILPTHKLFAYTDDALWPISMEMYINLQCNDGLAYPGLLSDLHVPVCCNMC